MNQGELIQLVRKHERDVKVSEARIEALEKKVHEMDAILKSPIRRQIYAVGQKLKQDSHERKHSPGDAYGKAPEAGSGNRV